MKWNNCDIEVETSIKTRKQLRAWFKKNAQNATQLWLPVKIGKPDNKTLFYIDTIEEALCFGWIDSINKRHEKYGHIHRLTPRKKNSHWTELNKERCRRLIKLKLMTEQGRKVLPDLNEKFQISPTIEKLLKSDKLLAKNFFSFPKLYQKIRIDSIQRYEFSHPDIFKTALNNFIKKTKSNKMYGMWNDYNRLSKY